VHCHDDEPHKDETMTDTVQLLIDAGVFPASPFDVSSRYHGLPLALLRRRTGEPGIPYVTRRFMPARDSISVAAEHLVHAGERPDTLAALLLADPLLYWRIADANAVIDPNELTDTVGVRVAIPLPPGMGGA
jgi:hypothetical protein